MIGLETVYRLMGLMLVGVTVVELRDRSNARRMWNAAFWGLYAVAFLAGSYLPDVANGALALGMVAVAATRGVARAGEGDTTEQERAAGAARWGNRLFVPALAVPFVTVASLWLLKRLAASGSAVVDPKQTTQLSFALGVIVALTVALVMLRPRAAAPMREARRLLDAVGWAAVLPQMLASLGAVFAVAGVGAAVSQIAERWLPTGTPLGAVVTYTVGMALFTIVMGNAFAAFPVMTAGIGLPIIARQFGGDVAIMAAVGMLSGFCGTLMTPMAANFNIVPAALLELPSEHAVIRAQLPTALLLLAANTALMYFTVFRH